MDQMSPIDQALFVLLVGTGWALIILLIVFIITRRPLPKIEVVVKMPELPPSPPPQCFFEIKTDGALHPVPEPAEPQTTSGVIYRAPTNPLMVPCVYFADQTWNCASCKATGPDRRWADDHLRGCQG